MWATLAIGSLARAGETELRIVVVTPAFNAAPFIGDAIRSVLAQTHRDLRLIIVDDGSTDGTAAVVKSFNDPRLTVIRQPGAGVSAARNRGIAAADGDAALFLDADDWLSPDALARLSGALVQAPRAVAAFGPYISTSDRQCGRERPALSTRGGLVDPLPDLLVRNWFANGGHLLIRHSAVKAAGLFRPELRYGEDWDYWIRIALQGPFVVERDRHPLLFVRSREGGAYRRHAADPNALLPCLDAIFGNPALAAYFGPARRATFRARAEAENHWVVGRELIRQGLLRDGQRWLWRSVHAAPSLRRSVLLMAAQTLPLLPARWRGPFKRYGEPSDSLTVPV